MQQRLNYMMAFTAKVILTRCWYNQPHYSNSYHTKGDIDTLLADKVSNIGDIPLPGMLDICTSAYTNSRIRCNAEAGGYTGYAELQAANSYDMLIYLSTARTDGGWMYFEISGDTYMQSSGSGNKVHTYRYTSISNNLMVGVGAVTSSIKAFASHNGNTSYCESKTINREHGRLRVNTDYGHGALYVGINHVNFFRLTDWNNEVNFDKNRQQELQMTSFKKKRRNYRKMLVKHYQK